MTTKSKNIFFWTPTILTTLFFTLMTYILIDEWWTVAVKKDYRGYLFGHSNNFVSLMDNVNLYSSLLLTGAISLFIILCLTIYFLAQGQKKKILFTLLTGFVVLFSMVIFGQQYFDNYHDSHTDIKKTTAANTGLQQLRLTVSFYHSIS